MTRGDITRSNRLTTGAALVLLILGAGPAGAGVVGFTEVDDQLAEVDPHTGELETIGPTGLTSVSIVALTEGPDGLFHGVVGGFGSAEDQLVRIDPLTGAAVVVGDLGVDDATGLAFDAGGTLWLSADGGLFSVDPVSGAATLGQALAEGITSLASWDGTLFGFTRDDDVTSLVTIDPSDGTVTVVADLPPGGTVTAADFDGQGTLWFRQVFVTPGALILPFFTYYRMPDPPNGVPVQTFGAGGPPPPPGLIAEASSLVVRGAPDTVEIPILDGFGLGLLAALLLTAGVGLLRRRRA